MSGFQFDTSGYVERPKGSLDVSAIYWSDLTPFQQGYVEAMFRDFSAEHVNGPFGFAFEELAFSDLAPETLARIIEDCAVLSRRAGYLVAADAEQGRITWVQRQTGEISDFPPLTPTLSEDGKVRFAP